MPTSHTPSPYPLAQGRNVPATKVRRCRLALLVVPTVVATSTTKFVPIPGPSLISFNSAESYTQPNCVRHSGGVPRAALHHATLYHIAPQNDMLHHAPLHYYAARCHTLRCTYPTHRITWCAVDWATQFGCGENDVVDLNVSDAYWSLYYVTVDRMIAGARLTFMYCLHASVTLSHLAFDLVACLSLFIAVL